MSQVVKTLKEVGAHFGKCARTTQRWRRAGMPGTAAGYDLAQVEEWLKTTRYLGSSLRRLEQDNQTSDLFERAVLQLRRGLQDLCLAYLKARGKGRQRLIDRAVRNILYGAMKQADLLERKGGEAARPF